MHCWRQEHSLSSFTSSGSDLREELPWTPKSCELRPYRSFELWSVCQDMRGAAIAIKDEVSHQALELLLADERLRPLIVGVAARPELHEIVDLIQQRPATPDALNAARLVITDPAIAELVERVTTTGRVREAMELAAVNPEFVFFGRNAATGRSLCARLARLLLRIRKVLHVENAP